MLIIWIFFVTCLLLFVTTLIRLISFIAFYRAKSTLAKIVDVNVVTYPMQMTTGQSQYELVVKYAYDLNGSKYTGRDVERSAKLEKIEKLRDQFTVGSNIPIKVLKLFPDSSFIFVNKTKIALLLFVCAFSGLLSSWIFLFIDRA